MSRALVVAALLLVGAGCGGDDSPTVTGVTQSTTTTTEPTTTTAPTTTATVPACEAVPEAEGSSDVVERSADVDGDEVPDLVRTERPDPGVDQWLLTVDLAAGGGAQEEIPGDGVAAVTIIGGHDLDGDGADELWVRVGAGAYATILGLFRLDGCDLERLTSAGRPTELPVGSSVGSAIGVECTGTEPGAVLTTYGGNRRTDDDRTFDLTTTEYSVDDGVLVVVREETTKVPADDPGFERYVSFTCGELSL